MTAVMMGFEAPPSGDGKVAPSKPEVETETSLDRSRNTIARTTRTFTQVSPSGQR